MDTVLRPKWEPLSPTPRGIERQGDGEFPSSPFRVFCLSDRVLGYEKIVVVCYDRRIVRSGRVRSRI
jgi:hypothetical protein